MDEGRRFLLALSTPKTEGRSSDGELGTADAGQGEGPAPSEVLISVYPARQYLAHRKCARPFQEKPMSDLKKHCSALYTSLPRFVRYAIPLIAAFTIFIMAEHAGAQVGRVIYWITH